MLRLANRWKVLVSACSAAWMLPGCGTPANVPDDAGVELSREELVQAALGDPSAAAAAARLDELDCAVDFSVEGAHELPIPNVVLLFLRFAGECDGGGTAELAVDILPNGTITHRHALVSRPPDAETGEDASLVIDVDPVGTLVETPLAEWTAGYLRDHFHATGATGWEVEEETTEGDTGAAMAPLLEGCTAAQFVFQVSTQCTVGTDSCLDCREAVHSEWLRWNAAHPGHVDLAAFLQRFNYYTPFYSELGLSNNPVAGALSSGLCSIVTQDLGVQTTRIYTRLSEVGACGDALQFLDARRSQLFDSYAAEDSPASSGALVGRAAQRICAQEFLPEMYGPRPFCPAPECSVSMFGNPGCSLGTGPCVLDPVHRLAACQSETLDATSASTKDAISGPGGYCDYYPVQQTGTETEADPFGTSFPCPCPGIQCAAPADFPGQFFCLGWTIDRPDLGTTYTCCDVGGGAGDWREGC